MICYEDLRYGPPCFAQDLEGTLVVYPSANLHACQHQWKIRPGVEWANSRGQIVMYYHPYPVFDCPHCGGIAYGIAI